MRDLDFHGLLDDIGSAAKQPEFSAVRRRASRLRTRRHIVVTAGALAVAAVLILGGYLVAEPSDGSPGRVGASPGATIQAPAHIRWADAGDADHLYALVADCGGCRSKLMVSEDGGRTWRERPAYAAIPEKSGLLDLYVLGPRVLALGLPEELGWPDKLPASTVRKVSLDGGATWRDLQTSQAPVAAAPVGTRLIGCQSSSASCGLHAIDPVTGILAPLSTQPPLADFQIAYVPPSIGMWVQGYDPATHRPAVAVSHDRGRTWTVTVFTAESPAPVNGGSTAAMYQPAIATADGQTAYATILATNDPTAHLYRSTDGGGHWQRTNPDGPLSGLSGETPLSFVTADGAHVMLLQDGDTFVFWISTDGKTYTRLTAVGAPTKFAIPPTAIDKDRYLLYDDQQLYLSDNGRNWHRATTP
jgi:photosystem II stability/assembly factor-like uncharacterized protein